MLTVVWVTRILITLSLENVKLQSWSLFWIYLSRIFSAKGSKIPIKPTQSWCRKRLIVRFCKSKMRDKTSDSLRLNLKGFQVELRDSDKANIGNPGNYFQKLRGYPGNFFQTFCNSLQLAILFRYGNVSNIPVLNGLLWQRLVDHDNWKFWNIYLWMKYYKCQQKSRLSKRAKSQHLCWNSLQHFVPSQTTAGAQAQLHMM